jgi:hypothetical protein
VRTILLDGENIFLAASPKAPYILGDPLNFVPAAAVRTKNEQKNHNKNNQQKKKTKRLASILQFSYDNYLSSAAKANI